MSRTPEANIEPSLLVWARTTIGLDLPEAAKKIGVSENRLLSWEAGDARPSVAQLRKSATVYKRPLAVFFLASPPRDFQPLRDFRRMPGSDAAKLSPELLTAIRTARFQREAALELRQIMDEAVADAPRLDAATGDPEVFGRAARALLGVSLDAQKAWRDPGQALNGWIQALEDLDVLALHASRIDVGEMRGFSISAPQLPVVVLNGADAPRGRIFTLLHEAAHILLNNAGICDLHDRRTATDDLEVFCNRVAAAVLLPEDAFLSDADVRARPSDGRWADERLRSISERYSVSQEVVLRRLFYFDLTSWDFLQEKRRQFQDAYEEQKQREAASEGGPSWYRMRVRDLGRAYVRTALEAYHRDEINASQVSGYLGVKVSKLQKLEAELARSKAGG
jgi:Zn-dependent peptidase ImmA (M78 family)/DNA-binding XRE family transcriptional regulator